jgi:hypothetical protein
MALTDTFVRTAKSAKPAGQKHADGNGMYLLVTPSGKYWRLDYRHLGKRKTLALGVYPTITLAKARTRCADARRLIADGRDPSQARQEKKQDEIFAATQTFELVARMWMEQTAANRAETTRRRSPAGSRMTSSPISAKPLCRRSSLATPGVRAAHGIARRA